MMHDPTILWVSLLSGILSLDVTVAVQAMVSRPLVCGFLTGWLLGDIATGVKIGCLLELLWSGMIAVGAFVPPDFQSGSVFTAATAIILARRFPGVPGEAVISLCLALAIPLCYFSGLLEVALRNLNVRLAHWTDAQVGAGHESALGAAAFASVAMFFLKGTGYMALCLAVFPPLVGSVLSGLPAPAVAALTVSYWMAWALGFAVVLDLFWSKDAWAFLLVTFCVSWFLAYAVALPNLWLLALAVAGGLAVALTISRTA